MFQIHKKPQGDAAIKKSIQKLLDPKKDVVTRLKHLKNILENATDENELKSVFELYHSHIFYIFFENFLLVEANVRQKGAHKQQREELNSILLIFQHILVYLPDLIQQKWNYNSIETIIKKLLSPQNSLKVRKEGIRLFLLWLQALQHNTCESTMVLYACLVPGFPPPKSPWGNKCTLETLLNPLNDESTGVFPIENTCLVPPSTGEISPPDFTKYFLDTVLECMVKEALLLQWKQKNEAYIKSFTFLWDLFKKYYLPHIFDDFRKDTSVYKPILSLPEPRSPYNYLVNLSENILSEACVEVTAECAMLPARVSVIKWIVVFISNYVRKQNSRTSRHGAELDGLSKGLTRQEAISESDHGSLQSDIDNRIGSSIHQSGSMISHGTDNSGTHSNTSTLTEKEPSVSSLSSLDDKLRSHSDHIGEEELVRKVLYSTRENINIVHEVFRQAFILPLTEAPTMRKVIKVYQEWIQERDLPVFMEEVNLNDSTVSDKSDDIEQTEEISRIKSQESSTSLRNVSYMRGQLNSVLENASIHAGCQTTYQLFITNAAHVFLVETPRNADKLMQAQVDVCKRVLNLYRHMVMNIHMDDTSWTQLLQVLLHVTRIMLEDADCSATDKLTSVAGRLASPMFQTLIVSWIKANLFVHVSRDIWDELVDVLSNLSQWKELIVEWAKNMETMTRVLARHVYGLELSDLPLDRLTEQKQKKKGKTPVPRVERPGKPTPERSFSRGWSQTGMAPASPRARSKSALTSGSSSTIPVDDASTMKGSGSIGTSSSKNSLTTNEDDVLPLRQRSVTTLGLESVPQSLPLGKTYRPNSGHNVLKRGQSDSVSITSPSSEDPQSFNHTLDVSLNRSDSLQRSCSTSDISKTETKSNKKDFERTKQTLRQRCNSGPDYPDSRLKPVDSTQDMVSLSSVEDAFNDMFDELAHERLKSNKSETIVKEDNWRQQNDSVSIQSQDSASIDTNWNPWAGMQNDDTDSANTNDNDALTPNSDKDLSAFNKTFEAKTQLSPPHLQVDLSQNEDLDSPQESISQSSSFSSLQYDAGTFSSDTLVCSSGDPANIDETISDSTNLPKPKRVCMLIQKKNSSAEVASPPYHIFHERNTEGRDRYDSTALLLPDLKVEQVNVLDREMKSIGEEESDNENNEGEIMEQSSDDILNVQQVPHDISERSFTEKDERGDLKNDKLLLLSPGAADKTDSLTTVTDDRSILAGGKRTGWYPDVAVALWRRLLGVLGDINEIKNPAIHKLVFSYLLKFLDVLFKMRDNLGITSDNQITPTPPELVPPVRIMAPWGFKAVLSLPETHKTGKSEAYKLLCNTTLQKHDTRLEPDHLALFYLTLHRGLHSQDQDEVNDIVRSCCPKFFSCGLPGSTLLLLDFIYACHTVAASTSLEAPREEAQSILGSILCLPNLYLNVPVLKPSSPTPCVIVCNNVKEYVADALLTSGKKEPSAPARCIALSSLGIWLYEELTAPVILDEEEEAEPTNGFNSSPTHLHFSSPTQGRSKTYHSRVKEAINVLLVSLKFSNRAVASVACSQLHLLTHCVDRLLEFIPEMPARIIEVMSLSLSALLQNTDAKTTDNGRKLLVLLLLCLSDWCMAVPLPILTETSGIDKGKKLIKTVFKALQTGALGKPGHSAKHSYSLSDLASNDFDPHLPLDKVQEGRTTQASPSTPQSILLNKLGLPPLPNVVLGQQNVVSLTASTVLSHLTNHLGHFPMGRGPAVLNSLVNEQNDHGTPAEIASYDLSPDLFASPNVQFLIYNDTCLMSVVEIPSNTNDSTEAVNAEAAVRIIIRDTSGKFCWDATLMHGKLDVTKESGSVSVLPLQSLNSEISEIISKHCKKYLDYVKSEQMLCRRVVKTDLPKYEDLQGQKANDKMDRLLQYIGWTSPECQTTPGRPLNIPSPYPVAFGESSDLEDAATQLILKQHQKEHEKYSKNTELKSYECKAIKPMNYTSPESPFHYSRLLCSQSGFLAKENRRRLNLLKKNERLLRELKNLDAQHCRETHKVAVLYIAAGQEDKLSILSNTTGSTQFEDFIGELGWEVDLKTHSGFRGKLQSDGKTGPTAPYYATSSLEVVFHVSTRFPSTDNDSRNIKLKHLGNDEVHIVWSEHSRDYRRGIIPTEFGDVLIVIYPIHHGLFRIQIQKKPEVPFFGPLFDGAIINKRILPILVRETAINAGRAKRSQIYLYQPYYEERAKYLRQIIEQYKEDTTYENFISNLFQPAQVNRDLSTSSSSASISSNKKILNKRSPSPTNNSQKSLGESPGSFSNLNVQTLTSVNIANAINTSNSPTSSNHPRSTSVNNYNNSNNNKNSNNNNNEQSEQYLFLGTEDQVPSLPSSDSNALSSTILQHRRHSDLASHTLHQLKTNENIATPRPKPLNNKLASIQKSQIRIPAPNMPRKQENLINSNSLSTVSSNVAVVISPPNSQNVSLSQSKIKSHHSSLKVNSANSREFPSPPSSPPSNKKLEKIFSSSSHSNLPYQSITK